MAELSSEEGELKMLPHGRQDSTSSQIGSDPAVTRALSLSGHLEFSSLDLCWPVSFSIFLKRVHTYMCVRVYACVHVFVQAVGTVCTCVCTYVRVEG